MDTFRKWWNKPKADDQSLLARFYFADESLTAVASELDSFDGRAEPERCSRLVARLRQGQDQVLSITNVIMDELLADDRTPRAFRAKFPEEVLQESLAGQLWFGAECLAAGSSIMNRELESAAMRPLAKAVTKSLDNVRNLLREQCLRIKTPNAPRLNLDTNDACTETLCESLKIFDRLFAEFELLYVSAMVQVKTKEEHETQELICVLFSETLQRALRLGRLTQDQVDYFDPALMFSIPRLAIVAGLVIFPRGPLNMSGHTEGLSEMFRPFRTLLVKIRDLLRSLSAAELNQLEQLLCTNEEIGMQSTVTAAGQSQIEATAETTAMTTTTTTMAVITPSNLSNCDETARNEQRSASDQLVISKHVITDESATSVDCTNTTTNTVGTSDATVAPIRPTNNSINSTTTASTSVDTANSTEPNAGPDFDFTAWLDDRLAETASMASMHSSTGGEAAPSGFFLSNTNLGQLLQTVDTPLTDMFGPAADGDDDNVNTASDDENSVPTAESAAATSSCPRATDSGIGTAENTSLDRSPDSEVIAAAATESVLSRKYSANWERLKQQQQQQRRSSLNAADGVETTPGTSHHHNHHHHQHHHHSSSNNRLGRSSSRLSATEKHHAARKSAAASSSSSSSSSSSPSSSPALSASSTTSSASSTAAAAATSHSRKKRSSAKCAPDTSGDDDTSSSQSDSSDTREIQKQLAVRAAGRMKFKSTENLLHRLFVCIAGVADQLQTNFASDLRQILRSVFLMNMSPPEEPPTIEPPPKDADGPATADLFEFRASEQDVVIQRDEREGSNQSIYSAAEEANAEDSSGADSVFGGEEAGGGGGGAGTRRQERSASFEAAAHRQAMLRQAANGAAAAMPRTRSLGEEDAASSSSSSSSRTESSDEGGSSNHNNGVSARPYTPSNELRAAAVAAASVTSAAVQVPQRHGSRGSTAASSLAGSQGSTTGAGSPPDRGRTMSTVAATSTPTAVTPSVQPPRWVPDDEAPRCMACAQAFTTFRRRHHCRNCGGVFCGVCSGASAPLPKFGLIKAVRVCRDCFVHEVGA